MISTISTRRRVPHLEALECAWVEDILPAWTTPLVAGSAPARTAHAAVLDAANRMWIFGGRDGSNADLNDVLYLDLQVPKSCEASVERISKASGPM